MNQKSSTTRIKRLFTEFKNYQSDPQISYLSPVSDQDLSIWTAIIEGPQDSAYAQGFFKLELICGMNYPHEPPEIKFITRICHPNIHFKTGEICLDLLKNAWSPAWTLQSACIAISVLLTTPEYSSPLNCDAANLLRCGDERGYRSLVTMYTRMYAGKSIKDVL